MPKPWRIGAVQKAELIERAKALAERERAERDEREERLMPSPLGRLFSNAKFIGYFESPLACQLSLSARFGARSRLLSALADGADPDVGEPVDESVARQSPLAMCAGSADVEGCLALLLAGADPDGARYAIPPLRALMELHDGARVEQRVFLASLLLAAGADPDGGARRESCGRRSELGIPLFGVCESDGVGLALAPMLVAAGADVDQRGCAARAQGSTPMMRQAMAGNEDELRMLVALGADPRAVDDQGRDAAMWAASTNRPEMVKLCLALRGDGGEGLLARYPSWREERLSSSSPSNAWLAPFDAAMARAKERREVSMAAGLDEAASKGERARL